MGPVNGVYVRGASLLCSSYSVLVATLRTSIALSMVKTKHCCCVPGFGRLNSIVRVSTVVLLFVRIIMRIIVLVVVRVL